MQFFGSVHSSCWRIGNNGYIGNNQVIMKQKKPEVAPWGRIKGEKQTVTWWTAS